MNLLDILSDNGREHFPRAEEQRLIRRAQQGHQQAIDDLMATLYWTVLEQTRAVAGNRTNRSSLEKLASAGVQGALESIHSFDLDNKDTGLRTFALFRIRGAIMREVSRDYSPLYVPHNAVSEALKLRKGATPEAIGITDAKATSLLSSSLPPTEIDSMDDFDLPAEAAEESHWVSLISEAMHFVNPDAYFVTAYSYGILGFPKLSRKEVCQVMHMAKDEVAHLLEEGTLLLRDILADDAAAMDY